MVAIVAVYFLGLMVVGAWASKKVRTSEDYILAGRNLGFWVFTILIVASICSGMTILGTSGLGYVTGWPTIWEQVFVPLSAAVCILLFGTKLHAVGRDRRYLTVQDYFSDRFYSKNGIRGLSAVTGILVSLIYMVGQFVAISMVLSWLFGISYHAALILSALIVTAYVIMGGLYAVAWSSLIQGLMLIVGVLLVAPAVIRSGGGLSSINAVLAGIDPNFVQPWYPSWYPELAGPYAGYAFATPIFLVSFFFLLAFGLASAPHVINNVFAARDEKYFKWAPLAAFAVYVVIMYLIKITGYAGRSMAAEGMISLPTNVSNPSDYAFILGGGVRLPQHHQRLHRGDSPRRRHVDDGPADAHHRDVLRMGHLQEVPPPRRPGLDGHPRQPAGGGRLRGPHPPPRLEQPPRPPGVADMDGDRPDARLLRGAAPGRPLLEAGDEGGGDLLDGSGPGGRRGGGVLVPVRSHPPGPLQPLRLRPLDPGDRRRQPCDCEAP